MPRRRRRALGDGDPLARRNSATVSPESHPHAARRCVSEAWPMRGKAAMTLSAHLCAAPQPKHRAGSNCPEGTKGHPPSSRMEMHCHTFSLPCPSFPLPFFLLLFPKDGRERAPWLCISFPSPPDLLSSAALQSTATRLEHGQFGFRERLPRRQPPPRAAAAARLRTSTRPSGRAGALLAPLPAVSGAHVRDRATHYRCPGKVLDVTRPVGNRFVHGHGHMCGQLWPKF